MSAESGDLARLRQALEPVAERAAPTDSCPAPERIWAAVQGELPADELRDLVDHMSTCLVCAEAWEIAESVNASRGQAGAVEQSTAPATGSPWLRWLSSAAAVVLLAAGAQWLPWQEWMDGTGYRGSGDGVIRSLIPEDETLSRQDCVLRWQGSEEGLTYDVRVSWVTVEEHQVILEEEGLVVSELRIPEDRLRDLPVGAKIIWRVEALRQGQPLAERAFTANLE